MRTWDEDNEWERNWWGDCLNTFAEEAKQITYAHRMGLQMHVDKYFYEKWPSYNLEGKNILDIGGGPASMLLKTVNRGPSCTVVDPCGYPAWTMNRYAAAGIRYIQQPGEERIYGPYFDECWIYNCLQHTMDPEKIIQNARASASVIRIFEWIDRLPCVGHPQTLTASALDRWLSGTGTTENMDGAENNCCGPAYYGVFTT